MSLETSQRGEESVTRGIVVKGATELLIMVDSLSL
jgi:hypothetical protein